jgi:hypothetical protein
MYTCGPLVATVLYSQHVEDPFEEHQKLVGHHRKSEQLGTKFTEAVALNTRQFPALSPTIPGRRHQFLLGP